MKLTYFFPEENETPEDACELKGCTETDPRYFAQEAAEYCQNERDGWEWEWPVVFGIARDGVEVARFNIEREMVPEFYATPVKPKP